MNISDLKKITNIQLKTKERQELLGEFKNIEGLCHLLNVNPATGLVTTDTEDLRDRAVKYGVNELPQKKSRALINFIWQALHDKLLIVLMICALTTVIISISFDHKTCNKNNPRVQVVGKPSVFSYSKIL